MSPRSSISFDNGEFLSVVAIKFDRKLEPAMYHVYQNRRLRFWHSSAVAREKEKRICLYSQRWVLEIDFCTALLEQKYRYFEHLTSYFKSQSS